MLRLEWIGAGLGAAWGLVALVACGSSANAGLFGGMSDGGSGNDASTDSPAFEDGEAGIFPDGSMEASGDASLVDAGPPDASGPPPAVILVHASPDLPDLRFCWSVNGGAYSMSDPPFPSAAPAPASNYAAVPVGGAATLGVIDAWSSGSITLVGIDAYQLSLLEQSDPKNSSCGKRLGTGAGAINVSFRFPFPPIPASQLQPGATNLVAVAGCTPGNVSGSVERCGLGWTEPPGNLHVEVVPLAAAFFPPVDGGGLNVQGVQASPSVGAFLPDGGAATLAFGPQSGADGGIVTQLGAAGTAGAPTVISQAFQPTTFGQLGFSVDVPTVDAGTFHTWASLEQSLELVSPMTDPSVYYDAGVLYAVALVGMPQAPTDGGRDPAGMHVLVLPAVH